MIAKRLPRFGVVALVVACAATPGARMSPPEAGASPEPEAEGPFLYVANQNGASVSVVDVATRSEAARVDLQALGFGPNARPHDTAVLRRAVAQPSPIAPLAP